VLPRPLSPGASLSLARLAFAEGGRGAYARLLADSTAPLAERLAAAAQSTPDALLALWHKRMLAARPAQVTTPWWGVSLAIAWVGVFGATALRSSRWRAG
jgi:hypothetical protein